MKDVKIERKELSNGLQAVLITLDGVEGMTFPEVVRVLGIPEQTVRDYRKANRLQFPRISVETASTLRKDNVISVTGRAPNFVPKTVIKDLVRFYDTPETNAIYDQLWDVSEAVFKGDYVQAAKIVGTSYDDLARYLNLATDAVNQLIKQRDAERTAKEEALKEVKHKEHYAVTNLTSHGVSSFQLVKAYPSECYTVIDRYRAIEPKAEGLSDTGALTMVLRESGIVSYTRIRTRKGWTTMFDKDTVEAYIKGVK